MWASTSRCSPDRPASPTSWRTSSGVRVTNIVPGGPFALAQGQVGDILLALGGVEVRSDPDFDGFRRRWAGREGEAFEIVVRRAGRDVTLTAHVMLVLRTDTRLEFDANAGPKAVRIRAGLLRGITDR